MKPIFPNSCYFLSLQSVFSYVLWMAEHSSVSEWQKCASNENIQLREMFSLITRNKSVWINWHWNARRLLYSRSLQYLSFISTLLRLTSSSANIIRQPTALHFCAHKTSVDSKSKHAHFLWTPCDRAVKATLPAAPSLPLLHKWT